MHVASETDDLRLDNSDLEREARVDTARDWLPLTALGATVVAAVILRVWGIEMGLPLRLHPDEWRVVMRAMALGTGDLDPGTADVGHLMIYLSFLLFGIYGGLGLLTGRFESVHDIGVSFCHDPSDFYLLARGISLVTGVAAVVLIFLIGRKLRGPWAGAAAAAFVAVNPVHIERSHLAYPDALMVALMLGALYVMVRESGKQPRLWRDFLIGLLIGLAISAKYVAAFMVPAYIAWRLYEGRRGDLRIGRTLSLGALCAAGCIVGFGIGSPFALVHASNTARTIIGRSGLEHDQITSLGEFSSPRDGLRRSLRALIGHKGIGAAGALLAVVGLVGLPKSYRGYAIALGVMLALNSLWVINHGRFFVRWLFPSTIALTLVAAAGVATVVEWLRRHTPVPTASFGAVGLVAILVWPHVVPALGGIAGSAGPHTQTMATEWIEANIPSGTALLIVGATSEGPQPRANRESLTRMATEAVKTDNPDYEKVDVYYRYQIEASERYDGPTYDIHRLKHTWWRPDQIVEEDLLAARDRVPIAPGHDVVADLGRYLDAGVGYVITTADSVRDYSTSEHPRDREFYRSLAQVGKLVWDVAPNGKLHGSHILVFATPNAPRFAATEETADRLRWRMELLQDLSATGAVQTGSGSTS